MRDISLVIALGLMASLAGSGCGKSGEDASDGIGSQVAVAAISGGSDSSEGSVAFRNASKSESRAWDFSLIPSAWAVPACSWSSLNSGCSSDAVTVSYSGCASPEDRAISISGSETLSWTGTGCCNTNPLIASSATPCSYTRRTITASGSVDPLVRSVGSNSVTLNTEDSSGYAAPKTGGFSVVCQGAGGVDTCQAQREISISGAHYTGKVASVSWDHTVSTDTPLVIQGSGATRRVLSGAVRVQHNLAKYTSVTQITQSLTHSAGCCYPVGGEVTTSFSGGKLDGKSETMTFGPGCGDATLTDSKQQRTGLTLHHCL